MRKLFILLSVALTLVVSAPSAQAITLEEQRVEVFVALGPVLNAIDAELDAKIADFRASRDVREREVLRMQIAALQGRYRFVKTSRENARYRSNAVQLDLLINRYDLNVSLS